jgi:biofilm PGA synthesis N-glycosyltransferase PgaC
MEAIFWLSAGIILYTYLGYPLVIALAAKLFNRPILQAEYCPELTVIVIAHNEAATIATRLDNLLQQDYPADKIRILVASDGSTDATNAIVADNSDARIELLAFDSQRGKAACLNDAVASCQSDYIVFADARQRFEGKALRMLMENFADPSLGAVSGELVIETEAGSGFSEGVDFYWRYEKLIRQAEARVASVVGVTGAIYALRKSCFKAVPAGLILDDVLIPMNTVRAGLRVGFEPRALAYDIPPPNPEWEHRRKVRTLAGNYQLVQMSPGLLAPWRNPIWPQFVSHKILRLVAPLFLLLALISNTLLLDQQPVYPLLLVIQLLFYGAALVGIALPASHKLSAIRIPMTFCRLNWSAVLGFREFIARRSRQLW